MKHKIIVLLVLGFLVQLTTYGKEADPIVTKRDITQYKTTIDIPLIGLSMDIPESFNYALDGRSFDFLKNDTIQIQIEEDDLHRDNGVSYDFDGKDFSISLFVMNGYGPPFQLQNYKEWSEYKKMETFTLEDKKLMLLYCGSESYGTLCFYITLNKYQAVLSFSVYGNDNAKEIDKVIRSIKLINPGTKKVLFRNWRASQYFDLMEGELPQLDDLKSKLTEAVLGNNACTTSIRDMGLQFTLPSRSDNESNLELDSIKDGEYTQNIEIEIPSEDGSDPQLIEASLAIYYDGGYNGEDRALTFKRSKAKYENFSVVPQILADVISCNGLEWSVLIYSFGLDYDKYTALSMETRVGDYKIRIRANELDNLSQAYYLLNYLQTFRVKI